MRPHPLLGLALLLCGCLEAKDSALFSGTGLDGVAGAASSGGSSSAQAGTDSGSGAALSGGTNSLSGSDPGGGGASGSSAVGGHAGNSASAGGASDAGSGGHPSAVPEITDCSMVDGAVISEHNGHCYRVDFQNLDFQAAVEACAAAGGHLVTIASAEENAFVAALHEGEHWIGATDGRPDTMPGAGTYAWVTGEPWTYADWEQGQPNAYESDCPAQGDDSDCFEHCAFQSDDGDWNDRSCWHTVVSICEWDVEPASGAGGANGSPADESRKP